jgi:hypothetical protein
MCSGLRVRPGPDLSIRFPDVDARVTVARSEGLPPPSETPIVPLTA